jgi:hypothetical protein
MIFVGKDIANKIKKTYPERFINASKTTLIDGVLLPTGTKLCKNTSGHWYLKTYVSGYRDVIIFVSELLGKEMIVLYANKKYRLFTKLKGD